MEESIAEGDLAERSLDENLLRDVHAGICMDLTPEMPPVDCGFALRLRFAEPVRGPLCLGYGSHFGLGLFQAEA
jgi:hypothetical protein